VTRVALRPDGAAARHPSPHAGRAAVPHLTAVREVDLHRREDHALAQDRPQDADLADDLVRHQDADHANDRRRVEPSGRPLALNLPDDPRIDSRGDATRQGATMPESRLNAATCPRGCTPRRLRRCLGLRRVERHASRSGSRRRYQFDHDLRRRHQRVG